MFSVNELLSKNNRHEAYEHFSHKSSSRGTDGMLLSQLPEYWKMNGHEIEEQIRQCKYVPGIIKNNVIVGNRGKVRVISNQTAVDKLITRMLSQKLNRYFESIFLTDSYAYQYGKGTLAAASKARDPQPKGLCTSF